MTPQVMIPVAMIEPSSWLRSGIRVEQVDGVNLVKLTQELHTRLEELLEKRKAERLTPVEEAEYTGISELERILTFVNAKLIASHGS
jgi:type II secretory pathway predicted ATPase ExeA